MFNVKHVSEAISTSRFVCDPKGLQWLKRLCKTLVEQIDKSPTVDTNKRIIKQEIN